MNRYFLFSILIACGVIALIFLNDDSRLGKSAAVSTAFAPSSCPANRDLGTHLQNQITSRISGITASDSTKKLYSTYDYASTTAVYVRNTDVWTSRGSTPIDLTGIPAWHYTYSPDPSNLTYIGGGTLISPRHIILADHNKYGVGTDMRFVAPDNTVETRRMINYSNIARQTGNPPQTVVSDIIIGYLDRDLPSNFKYYPVAYKHDGAIVRGEDVYQYFDNQAKFPALMLDQEAKALITEVNSSSISSDGWSHQRSTDAAEASFYEGLVAGDSGKPVMMIIDNQPIIMFTHYSQGYGPSPVHYLDNISQAVTNTDPSVKPSGSIDYDISTFDLSCFNRAPSLTAFYTVSVPENTAGGSRISLATSTDADGDTLTWSIIGGDDASKYRINSATGEVSLAADTVLDFESDQTQQIKIKVVDDATVPLSREQTLTISVTDVEDGPVPVPTLPLENQLLSSAIWNPSVSWGSATRCDYSYTGTNYISLNCNNNGSDIPAPGSSGNTTLYLKGTNNNGSVILPINFNYATAWKSALGLGEKNWSGIAMSSDGNKIWVSVNHASMGQLYYSTNSGSTWATSTGAGTRNWFSVDSSSDGTHLVASVVGGDVYVSHDSGATWTATHSDGASSKTAKISGNGQKIVALKSAQENLFLSNDGGTTWSTSNSPGRFIWRDVAISDDGQKIVALAQNQNIFVSTDGGITWSESASSGSRLWRNIAMSGDGTKLAAVVGNNSHVYLSTDSGATWTEKTTSLGGKHWRGVAISNDGTKIAATAGNGDYLYLSTDSGATWTAQTELGQRSWSGSVFQPNTVAMSGDGAKVATFNAGGNANTLNVFLGAFDYSIRVVTPPPPPPTPEPIRRSSGGGGGGGSSKKKPPVATNNNVPGTNLTNNNLGNYGTYSAPAYSPTANNYNPSLRIGSSGPEVTALQNVLISKGYLTMPAGVSKGYYGNLTETARARYEASLLPNTVYTAVSIPTVPTTSSQDGFYVGKSGADVTALQNTLINAGYLVMPPGVAKGYYGPLTKSAHDKYLNKSAIPTPAVKPAVTPTPAPSTGSLTIGSTGATVTELQDLLIKKGYLGASDVKVKGTYDKATSDAVKRFQYVLGLELTGNANNSLLESLRK